MLWDGSKCFGMTLDNDELRRRIVALKREQFQDPNCDESFDDSIADEELFVVAYDHLIHLSIYEKWANTKRTMQIKANQSSALHVARCFHFISRSEALTTKWKNIPWKGKHEYLHSFCFDWIITENLLQIRERWTSMLHMRFKDFWFMKRNSESLQHKSFLSVQLNNNRITSLCILSVKIHFHLQMSRSAMISFPS